MDFSKDSGKHSGCKNSDNTAELAATVNTLASLMAKGKSIEEIEMTAILFDMISDTLFAIALIEKKREQLQNRRNTKPKENTTVKAPSSEPRVQPPECNPKTP